MKTVYAIVSRLEPDKPIGFTMYDNYNKCFYEAAMHADQHDKSVDEYYIKPFILEEEAE